MIRNYVRRDVEQPDRVTNKVLKAGVQTSYVHSSIIALVCVLIVKSIAVCFRTTRITHSKRPQSPDPAYRQTYAYVMARASLSALQEAGIYSQPHIHLQES